MAAAKLGKLRTVRDSLNKSQSEMAGLLGVSTRAVQSFEQGWRSTPSYVQKMGGLLMFLNYRKKQKHISPCWNIRKCAPDIRAKCPAYQLSAGELCWLLTGTLCRGKREPSWEDKVTKCEKCSAMTRWLNPEKTGSAS